MHSITILLVLVTLLGCLPLILFLLKKRTYHSLISKGEKTLASISRIEPGVRGRYGVVNEKVHYLFTTKDGSQHTGIVVSARGKYRYSDTPEVYYLPGNPSINSVKTKGYGISSLLFLVAIALAIGFMMYKVYTLTSGGS